MSEGLEYHAIAFGQTDQGVDFFLGGIRVESEAQANLLEADWDFLGDTQGAAEVESAFGGKSGVAKSNPEGGRDGAEGHSGARDESLQQHVAGTCGDAVAAGGGVQAGGHQAFAGFELATDTVAEAAFGMEGDHRGFG